MVAHSLTLAKSPILRPLRTTEEIFVHPRLKERGRGVWPGYA